MGRKSEDITGKVFGRLTVISKTEEKNNDGKFLWRCVCLCGNEKFLPSNRLKSGNTQSCGCLQKDRAREYNIEKRASNTVGNTRNCRKCLIIKPLYCFYRSQSSSDGYDSMCTECDYFRRVQRIYGLNKDSYIQLLQNQDYKCPICKLELIPSFDSLDRKRSDIHVDHNHITKVTRGLLHGYCNTHLLGVIESNLDKISNVLEYLNTSI